MRQSKLSLLVYDRHGYGGSTRRPGRKVADAVDDVRALADAHVTMTEVVTGYGRPSQLEQAGPTVDHLASRSDAPSLSSEDSAGLYSVASTAVRSWRCPMYRATARTSKGAVTNRAS
jgi:hypothetical protein